MGAVLGLVSLIYEHPAVFAFSVGAIGVPAAVFFVVGGIVALASAPFRDHNKT